MRCSLLSALPTIGRCLRCDRGTALVEMAMFMSIVTLLGLGAIDFGSAFARQMVAKNATRAAAEYALAWRPTCDDETSESDLVNTRETIIDKLYEIAAYGTDEAVMRAQSVANVGITYHCGDGLVLACGEAIPDGAACESRIAFLDVSFTTPIKSVLYNSVLGENVTVSTSMPLD